MANGDDCVLTNHVCTPLEIVTIFSEVAGWYHHSAGILMSNKSNRRNGQLQNKMEHIRIVEQDMQFLLFTVVSVQSNEEKIEISTSLYCFICEMRCAPQKLFSRPTNRCKTAQIKFQENCLFSCLCYQVLNGGFPALSRAGRKVDLCIMLQQCLHNPRKRRKSTNRAWYRINDLKGEHTLTVSFPTPVFPPDKTEIHVNQQMVTTAHWHCLMQKTRTIPVTMTTRPFKSGI